MLSDFNRNRIRRSADRAADVLTDPNYRMSTDAAVGVLLAACLLDLSEALEAHAPAADPAPAEEAPAMDPGLAAVVGGLDARVTYRATRAEWRRAACGLKASRDPESVEVGRELEAMMDSYPSAAGVLESHAFHPRHALRVGRALDDAQTLGAIASSLSG